MRKTALVCAAAVAFSVSVEFSGVDRETVRQAVKWIAIAAAMNYMSGEDDDNRNTVGEPGHASRTKAGKR